MSDIVLRNIAPPKDDDILFVDIYSDGKARCYSWSDKWIDAEVIDSKPVTNADRIRAMTDEELAEFVIGVMCKTVKPYMEIREKVLRDDEFLIWLKSPEVDNG